MIKGSIRKISHLVTLLLMTAIATGCGGGGGGSDSGFTGGGGPATYTLNLSLTDSQGNDVSDLAGGESADLTVEVKDGGNGVSGVVVSIEGSGVTANPDSATTDSSGISRFTITANNASGAATITASVDAPSGTVTESTSFNTVARLPVLAITLSDESGQSLAAITSTQRGVFTVSVTAEDGSPMVGEVVSGSVTLGALEPENGNALTDGNGNAQFFVTADEASGAGVFTAEVSADTSTVQATLNYSVNTDLDVAITLSDREGAPLEQISPIEAGLFTVTARDPGGMPIAGSLVSATSSFGTLVPGSGTSITDANGVTSFVLEADGNDGAGAFSVSVNVGNVTQETGINFQMTSVLPYAITGVMRDSAGEIITSAATGERVALEVLLTESADLMPIAGQLTTATVAGLGTLQPDSASAITDSSGIARYTVDIGSDTGVFPVTVSSVVPGGSVTTSFNFSVAQADRRLGSYDSAGSFIEGVIAITPDSALSPGGTAALSFAVVDSDGQPVSTREQLTITSSCLFGGLATLSVDSPVALGAQLTVDYARRGCRDEDTVTAKLSSSGAEASGVIRMADAKAKAIRFEAANPESIALRGTGSSSDLSERSSVSFRVTDAEDNPVTNSRINFELAGNAIGGVALECIDSSFCLYDSAEDAAANRSTRDNSRSSTSGLVSTTVLAGTVATPVQVLAYIDSNENGIQDADEPATISKTLVVSTGLPDQNSTSLSASVLNVEGAYQIDGQTSELTVRMADKFNNLVPDGTAAVFSTELGAIVGSCVTTAGSCSVTWTSQSPRSSDTVDQYSTAITINENLDSTLPNRYDCPSHRENYGPCPDDIGDPAINPPGAPRGGRTTVLVTATGEESFVDRNGNGLYDEGEFWTNLSEAFADHNEDGVYTPTQRANCLDPALADDVCLAGFEETFVDRNSNGVFDLNNAPASAAGSSLPDGLYNGVLCSQDLEAAGICSRELVDVRDSLVLVNAFNDAEAYDLMLISSINRFEPSLLFENTFYRLYVADKFNNPPPPGSVISYENSGDCEAVSETQPLPDINKAGAFATNLVVSTQDYAKSLEEAQNADPDLVTIKLTLPNGSFTTKTYSCKVYRCADDPDQFPQFSPAPPTCAAGA